MLLATPFLLFAVGYWPFASCCSVFVSRCFVLVSRYSPACCTLLVANCTLTRYCCGLSVIPYSLLTAQLSLLSSRLVSSADRCTYSHIVHPCSRCVAVCLVLTLQYANRPHTLFLVARRSLFEICCVLIAARFALLSSFFRFSFLRPARFLYSYLAICRWLLSVFFKGPKLLTLMTLNVTLNFRSNEVGLN